MAPPQKTTKVLVKRRKFVDVEIPMIRTKIELIANSPTELENRNIKLDLTRQLKGKSVEAVVKIKVTNNKAEAYPTKIKLMPYFIRRMIRKRISYVEDSFDTKTQESMVTIKPFLITRKRVSRAIRKTLRNKTRNWIEDYLQERDDAEVFTDILTNKLQKSLSLVLKKTYPLSLCEIRMLEVKRKLAPEEVPKVEKKKEERIKEPEEEEEEENSTEDVIDQFKELGLEKKKLAEKEIKDTQEHAAKIHKESEKAVSEESKDSVEEKPKEKKKAAVKKKKSDKVESAE